MGKVQGQQKQRAGRWSRNKTTAQYLGVTAMTLWRWQRDPKLNFPAPSFVNAIPFTDLNLVDEWLRARAINLVKQREVA